MECDLYFSPSSFEDAGSFKLLELPPELCKSIEDAVNNLNPIRYPVTRRRARSLASHLHCSLTIKGHPDEDAVLCTADKTYALRSVVLSNSILVATAPSSCERHDVVIRDQLSEIVELTLSIPKLHKLSGMLKGMEYDETEEQSDGDERPVSVFHCSGTLVSLATIRRSGVDSPTRTRKQKSRQARQN